MVASTIALSILSRAGSEGPKRCSYGSAIVVLDTRKLQL